VVQLVCYCSSEFPVGRRSGLGRECLGHVEKKDSFEIKHDDGAMHYVIMRWLLMTVCSECVNIIDGKQSFH